MRKFQIDRVLPLVGIICLYCKAMATGEQDVYKEIRRAHQCEVPRASSGAFGIETLRNEKGRFVGVADYEYLITGQNVTIDGVLTSDGRFWPLVTAQIGPDQLGDWKTIEPSKIIGKPATFTVRADASPPLFFLDLDVFIRYVGRVSCARLILQNNQSTTLRLEDLSALKAGREPCGGIDLRHGWSVDMNFGGIPNPAIDSPLAIVNISEKDDHLAAEVMYGTADPKASATTTGIKAADGKEWLVGSAQVANDYRGVWTTIGECRVPGERTVLTLQQDQLEAKWHVNLDVFRPLIGEYRYGRVSVENGMWAVFKLKDLLPP